MFSARLVFFLCLACLGALFLIAWQVDRRSVAGGVKWVKSSLTYTLSIAVYCNIWSFYGAADAGARFGVEFASMAIGPALMFFSWWWLLRKIVRTGQTHKTTSIAEFLSTRFGKSGPLAVLVTLISILTATPFIAQQLYWINASTDIITAGAHGEGNHQISALAIAATLALFAMLFGTRTLNEAERHSGVMAAIAVEIDPETLCYSGRWGNDYPPARP